MLIDLLIDLLISYWRGGGGNAAREPGTWICLLLFSCFYFVEQNNLVPDLIVGSDKMLWA